MESCQLQAWRLELCGVAYASGHAQLSAGCTCCWDSCYNPPQGTAAVPCGGLWPAGSCKNPTGSW
jgi:hypothetical protein